MNRDAVMAAGLVHMQKVLAGLPPAQRAQLMGMGASLTAPPAPPEGQAKQTGNMELDYYFQRLGEGTPPDLVRRTESAKMYGEAGRRVTGTEYPGMEAALRMLTPPEKVPAMELADYLVPQAVGTALGPSPEIPPMDKSAAIGAMLSFIAGAAYGKGMGLEGIPAGISTAGAYLGGATAGYEGKVSSLLAGDQAQRQAALDLISKLYYGVQAEIPFMTETQEIKKEQARTLMKPTEEIQVSEKAGQEVGREVETGPWAEIEKRKIGLGYAQLRQQELSEIRKLEEDRTQLLEAMVGTTDPEARRIAKARLDYLDNVVNLFYRSIADATPVEQPKYEWATQSGDYVLNVSRFEHAGGDIWNTGLRIPIAEGPKLLADKEKAQGLLDDINKGKGVPADFKWNSPTLQVYWDQAINNAGTTHGLDYLLILIEGVSKIPVGK